MLIDRDQHCKLCGEESQRKLTVHHQFGHSKDRKRDPRRNSPQYMTILCVRCHTLYNWAMANYDRRHDKYPHWDEEDTA